MSPQERIILVLAEMQGLIDYRQKECVQDNGYCLDQKELSEDLSKITDQIENCIELVHQTYNDKEKVDELLVALLHIIHDNHEGKITNNSN